MAEVRMESLIRQYDDLTQNHQKLLDRNFVEELLSVLPICMNYRDTGTAQLYKNSNECEYSGEGLEITSDEVAKSCIQSEDQTKRYQILLSNHHVKKFLDFAIFLKTRNDANKNVIAALKSENDNLKSELEALKLHNLTLNESLNEEKLNRKNLEYLSEKLCSLLLKYHPKTSHVEELEETTTQVPCDDLSCIMESDSDLVLRVDTSTSEGDFDENNFSDTCDYDELLLSPPSGFRDEAVSEENVDPHEFFSKKHEQLANTNSLDEISDHRPSPRQEFNDVTSSLTDSSTRDLLEPLKSKETQALSKTSNADTQKLTDGKRKLPIVVLEDIHCKTKKIDDYSVNSQSKISSLCCGICKRQYASKRNLGSHIRQVHDGEKSHECSECGKRFAQKQHLQTHTFVHGSQKLFKCSVCNVGFKTASNKRAHEREVHEGDGNFQCAHCGKRFCRRNNLISHIHTKHFSGFEKPFKCTICHKSFALKRQLESHKFSHTSQRSFKCSVCDCYFKYHHNKFRHEKIAHGKCASFCCQHCDKSYRHKSFLIRHQQNKHAECGEDIDLNGL